jgi:hypothetical protein
MVTLPLVVSMIRVVSGVAMGSRLLKEGYLARRP